MTKPSTSYLIRGGRVICPASGRDEVTDVRIAAGCISELGPGLDPAGAPVLEAAGCVVTPGFFDLHVHLRSPGQEYKEDLTTGTAAAAAGGVTSLCCMPNTKPAIDCRSVVEDILARARSEGNGVRVLPVASVSRDAANTSLVEMAELKAAGAVAVSDDAFPMQDAGFMRRVFEYAATVDLPVLLHSEITSLSAGGCMNEGVVSAELGLRGIPAVAEALAVHQAALLALQTGARIHILHVSTAAAVEEIRQARSRGVAITAEACPHHFALTDEACRGYNTNAKMNPPLRTAQDVQAVIAGLADGTLDAIATDHAPHATHEKERCFDDAPFGIVGLETLLPLVLGCLVNPGHLTLPQAVAALTTRPAAVVGASAAGLTPGAPADVTVFDPAARWVLDPSRMRTKGRNTPFAGWEMQGQVRATLVGGRLVYEVTS